MATSIHEAENAVLQLLHFAEERLKRGQRILDNTRLRHVETGLF